MALKRWVFIFMNQLKVLNNGSKGAMLWRTAKEMPSYQSHMGLLQQVLSAKDNDQSDAGVDLNEEGSCHPSGTMASNSSTIDVNYLLSVTT